LSKQVALAKRYTEHPQDLKFEKAGKFELAVSTVVFTRAVNHVVVQHFVGHCFIRLVALGVHEDP